VDRFSPHTKNLPVIMPSRKKSFGESAGQREDFLCGTPLAGWGRKTKIIPFPPIRPPAYPPSKIRRKEVLFMAVFKDHKKDPDATLDWIFDWNEWLGATETIVNSEFIVDPGITVVDSGF